VAWENCLLARVMDGKMLLLSSAMVVPAVSRMAITNLPYNDPLCVSPPHSVPPLTSVHGDGIMGIVGLRRRGSLVERLLLACFAF
jgi:hypothetical protein